MILVGLILYVIPLKIALAMVDSSNNEFGTVFITALLSFLVAYVPCVGCFISVYMINTRHNISYGKGIVVYLIASLIPIMALAGVVLVYWGPFFLQ